MENTKIKELLEKALKDKEFVARIQAITTAEEAQKAFAEKGIEMTIEEVQQIGDAMANKEELAEEDLDNVSGGSLIGVTAVVAVCLAVFAVAAIKIAWGKLNRYAK